MRALVALTLSLLVACQSQASIGALCTSNGDCSAPLVCRLGRCRNECAANRDCPVGSQCFLDANGRGACELDVDRSCGAATACGVGLECLSSECVRACSAANECPSDGVCTIASGASVGVCTDPRVTSDAGPTPDAPSLDAGVCDPLVATSVCVGIGFSCALLPDHTVSCWGGADHGEIGSDPTGVCDTSPCMLAPVAVPLEAMPTVPLAGVQEISCGDDFACARLDTGHVRCWGRNYHAMLSTVGDEIRGAREVADANGVPLTGATALVSGSGHTCAEQDASHLRCWGDNLFAQLGRGTESNGEAAAAATELEAHAPFAAVFTMSETTCVVSASGLGVFCVGDNEHQQIDAAMPAIVPTATNLPDVRVTSTPIVGAGNDFACFVQPTGTVACWGSNLGGALGRNMHGVVMDTMPGPLYGTASTLSFDRFFSSTGVVMCGIAAGALYCWGNNAGGEAAMDPMVVDEAYPAVVQGPTGTVGGGCSEQHCCAVDRDQHVWCWGANERGQLGRGATSASEWMPAHVCR